jgi:hypothetical protein
MLLMSVASLGNELAIEPRIRMARCSKAGTVIRTVETPRTFRYPLPGVAGSVDVQNGLTADAALQESVKRARRLAPRGFELDLAVESPAGHQRAEAGEVAGSAGVGGELVGEVTDTRLWSSPQDVRSDLSRA